jgi:hypothetical protein
VASLWSAMWPMAPDSSQNLPLSFDGERYPATTALAAFTHSRGTPESTTGTAIHSLLSLYAMRFFFLYSRPSGPATAIWVVVVRLRLNHQMPYLRSGSKDAATSGDIIAAVSSTEWGLTSSRMKRFIKRLYQYLPPPGLVMPSRSSILATR